MKPGAGLLGLVLGLTLTSCTAQPATPTPSLPSDEAPPATPTISATTEPAPCVAAAAELSLSEQVGQLIMVGVTANPGRSELAQLERYHFGSVILTQNRGSRKQVAKLVGRLQRRAGSPGLLVAADQEGGLVQRLDGPGFATIPAAATQAKLSDRELKADATSWGKDLARAGVNLDLAPVADVVPAANRNRNQPIGKLGRGYGADPELVSRKVTAFSEGMEAAGVAVAVKHFPGLGAVQGNTDFQAQVVDRTTTAKSRRLLPFRDAVKNSVPAVMISSARYQRIDPKRPAIFSATVISLLRDWGFEGVVISDDLGVAKAVAATPKSRRATAFVKAGGDIAISVSPATAATMAKGLTKAARKNPELADQVAAATVRVLVLKQSLGVYRCG